MVAFWVGVISSLVASILLIAVTYLWSKRVRATVIGFFLRGSKGSISRQWSNRREGEDVFVAELRRAKWVKFMGSRGLDFQTQLFESIMLARPANSNLKVKVLLPDTKNHESRYWIDQRETELGRFDPSFSGDLLRTQIDSSVKVVEGYVKQGMLELRRHKLPHFGRLVATDNVIFLVGFTESTHGYQDAMAMHDFRSPVYIALNRLFDITWQSLDPVSAN